MIVWLASYPRSGNTLFRAVLYYMFGIRSGSVFPEPPGMFALFDKLSLHLDDGSLEAVRAGEGKVFVKTHRVADASDRGSAVYIVRDGRDAIVSYARFAKAQGSPGFRERSLEESMELLVRRRNSFGSWSDNVRAWTQREAPTAIVRFEELIEGRAFAVQQALDLLGLGRPEPVGELPSFEQMLEENPALLRQGRVGAWTSDMPASIEELFWDLHGAEMVALGYERSARSGSVEGLNT